MKTIFQNLDEMEILANSPRDKELVTQLRQKINLLKSNKGLAGLVGKRRIAKINRDIVYEKELQLLQVELIKLQNWVYENNKRVMIIFEGRDAAGKGGAIKRFTEYLNPRKYRVAALPKPTDVEVGQFYFQRYFKHLPNPGEIVFFDRSWYNRAIVEPVFGFCTQEQYEKFMNQVPDVEHALIDDGIVLIKFWFDIDKTTQQKRFKERMTNPLKHWKLSPIDEKAQGMWDEITYYEGEMLSRTNTDFAPWIVVDSNDKKKARLEAIRYVLSHLAYDGKKDANISLCHDLEIIKKYHREHIKDN